MARLGRTVGRMLLPAVMGVLIACVGWLVLTAALLHPSSFSAPLVEAVEQMLGSRYACVSSSDCMRQSGTSLVQYQKDFLSVYQRCTMLYQLVPASPPQK